jgi:hypothetical protein
MYTECVQLCVCVCVCVYVYVCDHKVTPNFLDELGKKFLAYICVSTV